MLAVEYLRGPNTMIWRKGVNQGKSLVTPMTFQHIAASNYLDLLVAEIDEIQVGRVGKVGGLSRYYRDRFDQQIFVYIVSMVKSPNHRSQNFLKILPF